MSSVDLSSLCVSPALTLRDALLCMDQIARGILLIVDNDGILLRTLTDGDLRRAIINHAGEDFRLNRLPEARIVADQ